jgi:lysophospholipase L1-like esterase
MNRLLRDFCFPLILLGAASAAPCPAQDAKVFPRPDVLPEKFEAAVRQYGYSEIDNPPVPGCSLFVGSSSFRKWGEELETVFGGYDAVNRGFGGSQIDQNILVLDRIHLPYKPARITHFCGGNDIAAGKTAESVFNDFKYYAARQWNQNPFAQVFFVSIHHAPVRENQWTATDRLNAYVKKWSENVPGLHYIDVASAMNDAGGKVRADLWLKDRLHLNDAGYAIWTDVFKKAFASEEQNRRKQDAKTLFRLRKEAGLFDDPRFKQDGVAINEPEDDVNLNIVFIGDSITIGGGDNSPPNRCAEYLKQQPGVGRVGFSNQGLSGQTTVDFLPSQKRRFPKVIEAADPFKNDKDARLLFSVMLGTNDSAVKGPSGSPVSPEHYRANLKEIVDSLLAGYPQAKLVLHRPIWYSETTQNSSTYLLEGQLRTAAYAPEIEKLVAHYAETPDKNRVFLGDTKAFYYFKKHYESTMNHETGAKGTFFLHPNRRGADILGRFWGGAIQDVIGGKAR